MNKAKIIVIGLDGATFDIINPWLSQVDCKIWQNLWLRNHREISGLL